MKNFGGVSFGVRWQTARKLSLETEKWQTTKRLLLKTVTREKSDLGDKIGLVIGVCSGMGAGGGTESLPAGSELTLSG